MKNSEKGLLWEEWGQTLIIDLCKILSDKITDQGLTPETVGLGEQALSSLTK